MATSHSLLDIISIITGSYLNTNLISYSYSQNRTVKVKKNQVLPNLFLKPNNKQDQQYLTADRALMF